MIFPNVNFPTRTLKLVALSSHPAYKDLFVNLTHDELEEIARFILDNEGLSTEEYLNNILLFDVCLDKKPEHYVEMLTIISACG